MLINYLFFKIFFFTRHDEFVEIDRIGLGTT